MDSILPSIFGITVLLTSALLLGRSGFASFGLLSDAWREAETRTMERLQSDITITSAVRTGNQLDLTIQNDGTTPVVDYSRVDVVLQYSSGGTPYAKYIPFTTDAPQPDDTWSIMAILNDVVDPRVLNYGETMSVRVVLNPPPDTANNWVQVTSEQGVSASATFN